jgi:transposase
MTPYSQDLRQRIVDTIQRGDGTIRQVAERFLVSFSFVTRLLQLYRCTGSVEPRPHGGGNPAVLTAMTRRYGRAPAGQRVYADTPGHWDSITLTCGMRLAGAMAGLAFPGATNTGTFETYVEEVLVPELRPNDVVIWDNLKPHRSEEAIEAVESAGAEVVPLPPYSPDCTPIEEMFSKVKGAMRSAAGRTKEAVYAAFASALHDVSLEDIAGWFQDRAAYAMQQ